MLLFLFFVVNLHIVTSLIGINIVDSEMELNGPRHKKTCLRGFCPRPEVIKLFSFSP